MKAKVWTQRAAGLILIVLSVIIIATTANGTSMIDRDITGILLSAPLGVLLILSKKPIFD